MAHLATHRVGWEGLEPGSKAYYKRPDKKSIDDELEGLKFTDGKRAEDYQKLDALFEGSKSPPGAATEATSSLAAASHETHLNPRQEALGGYVLLIENMGEHVKGAGEAYDMREGLKSQLENVAAFPLGRHNVLPDVEKTGGASYYPGIVANELSKLMIESAHDQSVGVLEKLFVHPTKRFFQELDYQLVKDEPKTHPSPAVKQELSACLPNGMMKELESRGLNDAQKRQYVQVVCEAACGIFVETTSCGTNAHNIAMIHAPKLRPGQSMEGWELTHGNHGWPTIGAGQSNTSHPGGISLETWQGNVHETTPLRAEDANHPKEPGRAVFLGLGKTLGSLALEHRNKVLESLKKSEKVKEYLKEKSKVIKHLDDQIVREVTHDDQDFLGFVAQTYKEQRDSGQPITIMGKLYPDRQPLLSSEFRDRVLKTGVLDDLRRMTPSDKKFMGVRVGRILGLSPKEALVGAEHNFDRFLLSADNLLRQVQDGPPPGTPPQASTPGARDRSA